MKRTIDDIRSDLSEAKQRLSKLEQFGNAAVSEWDLRNGYDAEFNIQLAKNHIAYFEAELAQATKHGEQLRFDL